MSSQFKVGDAVRCINNVCVESPIVLGGVYIVSDVSKMSMYGEIALEGEKYSYNESRFELVNKESMKKPHKHAAIIKAWADGATIQSCNIACEWFDTPEPMWCESIKYRVKPEPRPDYVTTAYGYDKNVLNLIRVTFDGETGKLKSAEVIGG